MVPRKILRQLGSLRRRERGLALLWGAARAVTVAVTVLTLACLADWTIDHWQDTPWPLRYVLFATQVVLWATLAACFLFRPLLRRFSNSWLSLYVEERIPELQHRLVSAVQLNRAGADTEGMSPEMIAAVTRQAEEQAGRLRFASLADHRRLRWSAALLAPVALTVGLAALIWPATVQTLLARQLLVDLDIPRSLRLENEQAERVCPAGEEVVLRFRARGDLAAQLRGEVRIAPEGQPVERYPLELESSGPDGAVFLAHIPPTTADFTYHARLRDARTRHPGHVHFEAAPAVIELRAWARLPDYCGRRPGGQPYEREQTGGDLALLSESEARVAIRTQKPVELAFLEVLAAAQTDAGQPAPERVLRRIDMTVGEDGQGAEGSFTPQVGEAGYRVVVVDAYGFRNADAPRRSIRLVPDEYPRVALLPELFPSSDGQGSAEDFEVSGIPVPLGGTIRLAYTCSSPYGLGRADQNRTPRLCYRINEGSWWRLPLKEVAATRDTGPFDPRYGAFEKSRFMDQVEYHAVSSPDPEKTPGRLEGGGRFDLQTRRIPGLKVGDRLELCLEVYDQNPAPGREPGRSESRIKTVVTLPEVETWVRETLQEESRIRQLEGKQEGIFAVAGTPDEEPSGVGTGTPVAELPRPEEQGVAPATTFIRAWQLIGPFASEQGQGHDKVFPIETEKTDLGRAYDGAGGKVRWKIHRNEGDKIELDRIFNYVYAGAAYAVCWVHSDRPRKVMLATGSDDGIKVWINRRQVLARKVGRPAVPGEDRELVDLKAGWSEVLVKIDNHGGMWSFFFELRDPQTNQIVRGLKLSTMSPTGKPTGFVRQWQIVGPFPNANDRGHEQRFPPEDNMPELAREYDAIKGKVRWKPHRSETDKIDLQQLLDYGEAGVAYALCWVRSSKQKALLATGSDDGIKVWINRRQALDRPVHREAVPGEDQTPIDLGQEWNEVLVKVDNRFGTWAFFLELREADGSGPLADVQVRTTPPGDAAGRFVRSWQVIGPFPNPDDRGHGTAYPPETEKVNLGKDYDGISGKVRWKPYHGSKDRVDLEAFFHRPFHESNVAYAVCWVHSVKAQPVTVATGSDDGIKVWLNRKLVTDKPLFREVQPGEDTERGELAAGWNEVLVKVDNRFGRWAFYLELRDPNTGQPLRPVQYRITPPKGDPAGPKPPAGGPVTFLRAWQMLGPLPSPPQGGYDHVYDPEKEKFNPGKDYAGIRGKIRWKPHKSKEDRIDLSKLYNHNAQGVAYAVCWVHSDRRRPVEFGIGSDDGIKVWLDRRLVFAKNEQRGALPGQDRALTELQAGWQEVLVKVDNSGGNLWAFYLELIDPATRKPIPGLKVRTTPP
jgi:hypothetical protein